MSTAPPPLPSQGIPPLLTKPTGKSSPARRLFVVAGVSVVVGVVLGLILWNQVTRKDTVENYAFLCEMLFAAVPPDGTAAIKLSEAEGEVELRKLKEELSQLSRRCRKLAPVARQYSGIIERAEELDRNAPQGSKIVFGLAEAALGAYTAQQKYVAAGGQKALQGAEHGWNFIQEAKKLLHQKHVLAVELAGLAPQFSGQMTNQPFVVCSFAEHTPGIFSFENEIRDVLSLVNASDRDLHNCVVSVRLSNEKGESYVNLHFAPNWLKDEKRVAKYSDTEFPKATVDGVTRVDVEVCTKEFLIEPIVLKKPLFGWPGPK